MGLWGAPSMKRSMIFGNMSLGFAELSLITNHDVKIPNPMPLLVLFARFAA